MTPEEYEYAFRQRQLDENIQRTQLEALGGDELAAQQLQANVFPGRMTAQPSSFNGSTTPPEQQMADQAQPLDEPGLRSLAGRADDPSQGGLGLARGSQRQSLPPANEPLGYGAEVARDLNDFMAELPFWTRQNFKAHGGVNQFLSQAMGQRQAQALKLQQLEETKKQHRQKMFLDVMTKPGLSDSQRQGLLQPFADEDEQFRTAIEGIGKKRFGKINSYTKLYPDEMKTMLQDWQSGQLTSDDIDQQFTVLEDRTKRRAAAKAEATEYKRLSGLAEQSMRDGTPMDSSDQAEFVRMQTEMAKRQEELQAIRLKNEMTQKKIESPTEDKPDRTEINRVSLAETGKPFDELPPGGPEQKRVIQAHAERYALGRTNVQMGTPAPTKDRVNYIDRNEFLKHDKLVNPPPGTSEGAIRTGSFVEMTDKQREDWGNLVNSGATLQTLFDEVEPLVTATNSAQAAKQFARLHLEAATKKNPQAATYLADSEAFSSRMARVFGSEVGVLTNSDVERWRRALPTFGDTKQVLTEKKRIFMSIYKQTKDMYKKKIAGEDYSEDLVGLRRGPLKEVDKIAPPSVNDDFNAFFGGK